MLNAKWVLAPFPHFDLGRPKSVSVSIQYVGLYCGDRGQRGTWVSMKLSDMLACLSVGHGVYLFPVYHYLLFLHCSSLFINKDGNRLSGYWT